MNAKLLIVLFAMLLFSVGSALGFTDNSFRHESTAFTLDDDFDQWVTDYSLTMPNPSGLLKIDGYRFYTNMSNLISKEEEQFSDGSLDNLLMGGSGYLYRGFHFGSIVERYADKWNSTDSEDNSELVDNDGNGFFDARNRFTTSDEQDSSLTETGILIALAKKRNNLDYGLSYSYRIVDMSTESRNAADTIETDLVTNLNNKVVDAEMSDNTNYKSNNHMITLGGLYRYSYDLSIGARLGIGLTNNEDFNDGFSDYNADRSPSDTLHIDRTIDEVDYKIGRKYSGISFYGGLTAEFQATPNIFSIVEVTGYTSKLDDDGGTYSRTIDQISYTSLGQDTMISMIDAGVSGDKNYELRKNGGILYHKSIVDLPGNLTLGVGLSLAGMKWESTLITSADSVSIESYDDGDYENNDSDDSTVTITSRYKTQERITGDSTIVSIPVGVEF
ncbi:MAG: hypothetical protein GF315_10245, partial [candidate division Zixibacteria bacterium]|nr:hypothetical protein [candidate division Zixibacteria bacterium]